MICNIGISRLINNLIQDKPWFKFDNKNFIQVLTSPNGKINPQNYYSVAETFANGLNKAINKDVEIGKIFFPKQYSDGTGILIKMNNVQSEILNSLSEREKYEIEEEEARVIQQEDANRAGIEYSDDYLFALDMSNNSSEQLEFHINTLNVVSTFLENIGVETRFVPEFLNQDGSVIEGAIAAANFMKGTVDIIDDLNKGRAEAWNKLPEEAAHWWYRLLKQDSILKDKLKLLASTSEKYRNLRDSNYANYDFDAMTEETIGQLIAESIKRIETKNGSTADYSFFKKFLEWINSIIDIFRDTIKDPFEVAAMKILSSDMSDLLTWEEYSKLNNIVNFADVLTNQSIAPIDYTIMSRDNPLESGNVYIGNVNNESEISYTFRDSLTYENNPYFDTKEEFERWFVQSKYYDEYLVKQRNIIQEVRDNQKFFDRLLNKTFKKRSKFLPKTLRKYYTIIDAQNLNKLQDWSINQQLHKIVRKLSDQEKQQIINTNGYTNIAPTLKVLPEILKKYKKNPIVLNDTIKIDSAKKQELSILNNIKDMIKLENPNIKTITSEEFVNEVHNWLEINYLLGFANENVYLGYHIDQTFQHLENRFSNEASPLANMTEEEINRLPLAERQRIANVVGLTRQNPDVYHNKVSIRFNDMSHLKSGHFNDYGSPSAWGNLTYFYTGKNRLKDAVLLHEIQNDNIEFLKEYKAEKVDLETSLGNYLMQLNRDLLDNITQIESGGKRIQRYKNLSTTSDYSKQYVELNFKIQEFMDLPLDLGLSSLKEYLNEQIELYKYVTTPEKIQEQLTKLYSQRRKFIDFQKRGGLKSLLNPNELKDLKEILVQLNTQEIEGESVFLHEENQWEPGYRGIRNLKKKKEDFSYLIKNTRELLNLRFKKMYGEDVPYINLIAPAKPLPKSQRRGRIVNIGTPREMRIGNASQQLNESVNFLLAFSEQNMSKEFSKSIEEYKKSYIHARNAKIKNIFNTNLSKINEEQYANLIENYKYNQVLLNKLIDEQARKDVKTQSVDITNLSDEEIIKDIEGEYEEPNEIDQISGSTFRYKNMYLSLNATTKEEAVKEIRDRYNPITQKENEQYRFEVLKQKALAKKEELEKDYDKIDSEARQTLETELNYFTPLVHHLIQKHINQYGKDFPMYFSGYQVTLLTQGNTRTALIYAGKEEINTVDRNFFEFNGKKYKKLGEGAIINADTKEELRYFKHDNSYKLEDVNGVNVITEQEYNKGLQEYEKAYQQATEQKAKEIKVQAAKDIGITTDNIEFETNYKRMEKETFSDKLPENAEDFKNALKLINEFNLLKKERDEILLKKLNEYKKQSKQNLDRVVNTIMNLSGSKPIETGAIYNAMTQISGVKLIWKDKIEGLKGNTGGYLVDLSNYNYNTPILYGMQNKPKEKPLFALNLSPIDQTHQPDSKFSSIQLSSELQKIYRDLAVKHNYDLGLIFPELLKDNNVIFSRAYVNDQNEEVGTYHYNFETDPKFTGLGKDLEAAKTALLKDKQIIDIDNNSTKNIQITINDKIIFGHPTIGKSFLKHKSDNRFISLDDDYGKEITDFVDANRGTLTRQEYKGSKPREYNEFMLSLYDIAKEKAFRENKQLFVSNTNILKERMSDFDKVISIPRDEFKRRFEERGATYGFDDWKSDIDATINKVNPNKVITTTGYLSDLLNENKGLEALNLKNVLYSAVFFNTNEITSKYKQVHPNLYSHHSTIEFKPSDVSTLPIGERKPIKIVGRLTTNKVDALIVENDLSKNKFPHITLSTAEGVKPFASNSEIENNQDKIVKLDDTITGKIGVFDGVNEITNTNSPLFSLDLNQVNYQFKAINNISNNLAKVNTWYRELKDTDAFWNKVQQDLQIPKEQIQLLRASKGTTIEEKLASFAANYSYSIEINIAKGKSNLLNTEFNMAAPDWMHEDYLDREFVPGETNTAIYSSLTVPGGTNYTENEISTPLITPSIKGHAQFATDNGIGWFRSDEQLIGGEFKTNNNNPLRGWDTIEGESAFAKTEGGTLTKTRRILEVQSDLFQKGRDKEELIFKFNVKETNDLVRGDSFILDNKLYIKSDQSENEDGSKIEYEYFIDKDDPNNPDFNEGNLDIITITKLQYETALDTAKKIDAKKYELNQTLENINKNQFLQLLNKDNNWITFFVKSILQDSVKKGYEKVLFPGGDTAAKIEKHETVEGFIKDKEARIKKLLEDPNTHHIALIIDKTDNGILDSFVTEEAARKKVESTNKELQDLDKTSDITYEYRTGNLHSIEIDQIEKEIEDAKAGKLKISAIAKFYEKTVFNILKKQGFKPSEITDEYDNKWFEVDLTTEAAKQETVLFALNFSNPVHQEAEVLVQQNKALIDKALLDIFFKFRENLNKASDLISDRERKRIKAMFGNNFKQQDVEDELVKIESTALTFGHMIAEMQVIFKNYDQEARDTINSTTLTNTEKVNKLTSINAFVQSFDKILKTLAPVVPNTSNQLFKMLAEIRTYKDSILGLYLDYIGDYAVESVYDILEGDAKIQFDLLTAEITRQQALYDTLIAKGNTKAAGARKARIDQLNAQIKELLPSKEKIQAIRLGKAKDSTWIQKLIEAAGMSGNPIVATVRSIIGNADLVLKSRINSVRNRIEKTIDSLGVLPTQVQKAFGKMLEEIEFNDLREDGTIKTGNTLYLLHNIKAEIYSIHEKLLNANKQAQTKYYAELEKQRLELSKGIVSTETADKVKELKLELNKTKKDLKTFSDKNIVRQFKKEYYDLFELLKVDYTGVNSNGDTITTNIGDYEFLPGLSLNIILNERRNLYNTIDIQGGEVTEEQAELLQYYKVQLDYLAGTQNKLWQPKTGIDLLISEKYNEYKLARKEVFDESFLSKEAEASWLANRARISEDNLNTWDSVHSRTIYKQSYWDEFNDIVSRLNSTIDAIRQIMGDLDLEDSKKITELWKELTEKTKKYRQSNGEINVDLLIKDNTPEFVQELKELELSIDELKQQAESLFGLNKQQAEEVSSLYDLKSKLKVRRKNLRREQLKLQKDKVANAERLEEIKLELELNKNEKEAADVKIAEFEVIRKEKTANIKNKGAEQLYSDYKKILKELGEIRSKGTSLEYEEKVKQVKGEIETNTLTLNNQELIDFLKSNGITIENEKDTNSLRKQYNEYIYKNSDWFKQNHIKRSRLVKSQVDSSFMRITSDEPIYIWNITRPSDESSIEIVPSYGYFTSKVKEDFINEDYEEGRVKFIENSETRNDKYYDLAKTDPKMFQVLNILTNEYLEAQKNYDEPGKRIGYRYPTVVKTGQERALSGEKFNNFKNNFTAAWKDMWSIDPNTIDELTDFGVNYERKTIPIMYSGLADESFLTRDVPKAIMMYIYGAEKYKAYKEVLPQVEAIQNSLVDTDKNVNTIDIVKETIKTLMYNNTISAKTKAGVITTKVVNNLTSLFSLKAFGLNIPPQVVNWLNGQINMWIMAGNTAGIIPYRYADYLSAKKEYFKWKSSLMADFKKSGDRSLLGQILDKYNVIQNLSTEFDRFHNTTLKSLATPHTLTFFKNFVEHEMAVSNFIAFAKFTQLKIVGSDKTISLFDAYELDSNGDLKLKAGVILDNKLDGALSNKFNAINYFIQGNYNKLDKTIAEKHAFGKLVFFMRNYMVPMLTQRFHPQRYNHQLGFIQEGYYLTFIKAMWTDLKNLQLNIFANYKNWTPAEQQAAFRIIKEMGALLLMTLLLILMGYDPKKKKPVEGESLANGTWWLNQATFVIAKLQMEIKTFTPTPAGIKALYQTAKEWTVMNNYVGDLLDVVKYLGLTIAGDDAAYYKNTVNPNIPWKEEGDSKLVAKALSLIGITGTQIAPSQALKNLEYSQVK